MTETDISQMLWGCYGCGYLAEGARPDACPVCGALSPEFEWFGPFFSATPEHLGQLKPVEVLATLEAIPGEVEAALSSVDDAILRRKPSEGEWCAKEVIGHMIETDGLFARRVRAMLGTQEVADVSSPVPPWKLQEGKGYEALTAEALVRKFRQSRQESLSLVRRLRPEDWARRGINRTAGRYASVSLMDIGTWLANHDRGHLAQVRRLCEKSSP